MHKKIILSYCLIVFFTSLHAQLTATSSSTVNTICDGIDCDYEGPSILINELMISPTVNDGSLFEVGGGRQGEWIELYNPDVCESVDISCYYLGNNATDGGYMTAGAGFQIPSGTVVPPGGFCLIRGVNAAPVPAHKLVQNGGNVVEVVMSQAIVCMQGIRLWFPNAGGWFAFYDNNGVPQDAVSWGNQSNIGYIPCVANSSGCNTGVTNLVSYNHIPTNRKAKVYGLVPDSWGSSIRRSPDGGPWMINSGAFPPTPGGCNAICAQLGTSTCDGTATVNPTGGTPPYTYSWDDSQGQTTQTAVDLCTGIYTVQVTDVNGLTADFTVEVEEYVPTVTFDMNEEVCNEGQVIPFVNYSPQATTGQTGEFTGIGANGNSFHVGNAGEGDFTVTYTFIDENSCTQSAEAYFTVNPVPEASISGLEPSYCMSNESIPITTFPSNGVLTGTGLLNNSFHLGMAGEGTHKLEYTVTNAFGCTDVASIEVDIFPNPVFTIAKIDSTCGDGNGEIIMNVTAGLAPFQYSIDGGATFQSSNVFSNLNQGNYDLLVTDANGCSSSATENLVSFPFPDVSAPEDIHICVEETVALNAINPDGLQVTWDKGVIDGVEFLPPQIGTTTYTVSAELGVCSVEDEVTVTVHRLPPVSAGIDYSICKGEGVLLSGVGAYSYEWSHGVENNVSFVPDDTETYVLTGTSYWGCINTDSATVTVHPIPEPSFEGLDLEGCQPHVARFFNTSAWPGSTVCEWSFGDGRTAQSCDSILHKYTTSGWYDVSLEITDENGCTGGVTKMDYVHVWPIPKASFYSNPTIVETSATMVNFFNTTHGGVHFTWDFGTNSSLEHNKHAVHTFPNEEEGNYIVTLVATNDFGCVDSTKKVIQVIEDIILYVPNTFTPDGDSYNQYFTPVFTQGYDTDDFVMYIYNRWGELIFETRDASIGWDGTYGGNLVKEGTYLWKIEFGRIKSEVREVKKGHINVLR